MTDNETGKTMGDSEKNPSLTIFTPTYNRAHTLERVYRSLQAQTCFDFEWLVVDDGSTDGTEGMFASWLAEENSFRLRYYKVENNEGLTRAYNRAFDLAYGRLFLTCGSDDFLEFDACEKILLWESAIKGVSGYAGVAGNFGSPDRVLTGTTFKGDFVDSSSFDMIKHNIVGDKAEALYTDIMRRHKYPEIEGEKFVTEWVLWFSIASEGYKIRWHNGFIRLGEYADDGLAKNLDDVFAANYKGHIYFVKKLLGYKQLDRVLKFKYVGYFAYISHRKGICDREACGSIGVNLPLYKVAKLLGRLRFEKLKSKNG
jgi:glycosyltransferase involved in cell wall biosynthesis